MLFFYEETNAIVLLQEDYMIYYKNRILFEMFLQIVDKRVFLTFKINFHADRTCRNVFVFCFGENNSRNISFELSRHSYSLY